MPETLLYLSRRDIEQIDFSAVQMLEVIDKTLAAKRSGLVDMPAKLGVCPSPDSFLHAMPGYVAGETLAGLKWVSYFPENRVLGMPTIQALIVLNDARTGLPATVLDGNWVTAYRTAAVSAYSCKLLSNHQSVRLALLGNGVQAESHLQVFSEIFDLAEVEVWGPNPGNREAFVHKMQQNINVDIRAVPSARMAIRDKDFVVSVTPIGLPPAELLRYNWVKPGAVVCPVEFDSAWDRELFQQAACLVTDDLKQFLTYQNKGYFVDVPQPAAELSELAIHNSQALHSTAGIKVAVNLGVGILDIAFAQHIHQSALDKKLGTSLPR